MGIARAVHAGFKGGLSVLSHPILSALPLEIFVNRAPVMTVCPTWDLPIEPLSMATLRDLSIKTTFLLLHASGHKGS